MRERLNRLCATHDISRLKSLAFIDLNHLVSEKISDRISLSLSPFLNGYSSLALDF